MPASWLASASTTVIWPSVRSASSTLETWLETLLERAKTDGYPGLSVSVERGKPETGTYVAGGFEQVAENGKTLILRRTL